MQLRDIINYRYMNITLIDCGEKREYIFACVRNTNTVFLLAIHQ